MKYIGVDPNVEFKVKYVADLYPVNCMIVNECGICT